MDKHLWDTHELISASCHVLLDLPVFCFLINIVFYAFITTWTFGKFLISGPPVKKQKETEGYGPYFNKDTVAESEEGSSSL